MNFGSEEIRSLTGDPTISVDEVEAQIPSLNLYDLPCLKELISDSTALLIIVKNVYLTGIRYAHARLYIISVSVSICNIKSDEKASEFQEK